MYFVTLECNTRVCLNLSVPIILPYSRLKLNLFKVERSAFVLLKLFVGDRIISMIFIYLFIEDNERH